jgi:hypothetical protein
MKKYLIVLSICALVFLGGPVMLRGQDQPKPKKDTVNIDTDARPTFYYPVEDDKAGKKPGSGKGSSFTIILIASVVVAGVAGYFMLKKKNK